MSMISLTIIPTKGFCDEWVKIRNYKNFTDYYNKSSVKIDREKKVISVLMKREVTEEGKFDLRKRLNKSNDSKINDIENFIELISFNYKEGKHCMSHITINSKSGILSDKETIPKWENIEPNSEEDISLNKLLKDYNIQR
jgi:hypothetical protein